MTSHDDAPLTITQDVADLVVRARAFTVTTADDYEIVAGFLLGIKALRQRIAETFDAHITRARAAHLALVQEKRDAEAAAVEAEGVAKALIVAWDDEQRRISASARATIAQSQQVHRENLAALAEVAEFVGDHVRADDLRTEAATIAPPLLPPPVPRVEGISVRETWTARVSDLGALVKAAATHPPYLALLKPDMPRLHAQARSLRTRLAIPGVDAICTRGVAASTRAAHGDE